MKTLFSLELFSVKLIIVMQTVFYLWFQIGQLSWLSPKQAFLGRGFCWLTIRPFPSSIQDQSTKISWMAYTFPEEPYDEITLILQASLTRSSLTQIQILWETQQLVSFCACLWIICCTFVCWPRFCKILSEKDKSLLVFDCVCEKAGLMRCVFD